MMPAIVYPVLVAALLATVCASRVSSWHTQESDYWYAVHARWLLDAAGTDERFLPVLVWARHHRPTLLERVRGWQPPPDRMRARHDLAWDRLADASDRP